MVNLSKGANAILISHLRALGGEAEVNCNALSQSHYLAPTSIYITAKFLQKHGFLTIQKNGYGKPPRIKLNEASIMAYEEQRALSPRARAKNPRRIDSLPPELCAARKNLQVAFNKAKMRRLDDEHLKREYITPLFELVSSLLSDFDPLAVALETSRSDVATLGETARSLGIDEGEVLDVEKIEIPDHRKNAEKSVPAIDFTEFAKEPAGLIKKIAMLRLYAVTMGQILTKMSDEIFRLCEVKSHLGVKIADYSSEPAVDLSACFTDWFEHGERVIQGKVTAGLATVSSRE